MKSWKFKLIFPIVVFSLGLISKFIFFEYPISKGKIKGVLAETKKNDALVKTWEINFTHSDPKVKTSKFAIESERVFEELKHFTGKEIEIFYEENILTLFSSSKFKVSHWNPIMNQLDNLPVKFENESDAAIHNHDKGMDLGEFNVEKAELLDKMETSLFCSTLGSLYQDKDLYNKVKEHLKNSNIYLYQQIDRCNN